MASKVFAKETIKRILSAGPKQNVSVNGWVTSRRKSKNVTFLNITDGSCFDQIQCCVPIAEDPLSKIDVKDVGVGSCVSLAGNLVESSGSHQSLELSVTSLKVHSAEHTDKSYPLSAKRQSVEFLRTQQHLRQRTRLFRK